MQTLRVEEQGLVLAVMPVKIAEALRASLMMEMKPEERGLHLCSLGGSTERATRISALTKAEDRVACMQTLSVEEQGLVLAVMPAKIRASLVIPPMGWSHQQWVEIQQQQQQQQAPLAGPSSMVQLQQPQHKKVKVAHNTPGLLDGVVDLSEKAIQWMQGILNGQEYCRVPDYHDECTKRCIPWRIKGSTSTAKIHAMFTMLLHQAK